MHYLTGFFYIFFSILFSAVHMTISIIIIYVTVSVAAMYVTTVSSINFIFLCLTDTHF